MEVLKITETLIVNGVVIANGVADSDGDILDKSEIKTINMKYERDTDTMHTNIKNDGVEVFNSWISEVDTSIGGKVAPAGSWMVTMKVTNPQLIQCITEGKLNGFSLGSVSEKAMTPEYWFINKSLNYRDIKDIEEIIPLFISFVDRPANQYGFEVMTYDAYINKKEKDVEDMTEKNEEMIPVSFVEKLMDKLSITKSEAVEVEKADEEIVEETTEASTDETVTALFEKLDTIISQNEQILANFEKAEEEVDEEEEIEKAEEEEEKKEEETSEEEEKEKEEDVKVEKSEEESSEEEVDIEKRQTHKVENQTAQPHKTFYQNTGRDSLGRKIRK